MVNRDRGRDVAILKCKRGKKKQVRFAHTKTKHNSDKTLVTHSWRRVVATAAKTRCVIVIMVRGAASWHVSVKRPAVFWGFFLIRSPGHHSFCRKPWFHNIFQHATPKTRVIEFVPVSHCREYDQVANLWLKERLLPSTLPFIEISSEPLEWKAGFPLAGTQSNWIKMAKVTGKTLSFLVAITTLQPR